jgi:hypothetical protein
MKFTETQLAEAIELIQASESQKARKDMRRAVRTSVRASVAVKLEMNSKAEWTQTTLHDISARGIRLEWSDAMEVGSSFLLRLPNKDEHGPNVPLICRVANCVQGKDVFLVGAEFVGRLTPRKSAGDNAADLSRIQQSILD